MTKMVRPIGPPTSWSVIRSQHLLQQHFSNSHNELVQNIVEDCMASSPKKEDNNNGHNNNKDKETDDPCYDSTFSHEENEETPEEEGHHVSRRDEEEEEEFVYGPIRKKHEHGQDDDLFLHNNDPASWSPFAVVHCDHDGDPISSPNNSIRPSSSSLNHDSLFPQQQEEVDNTTNRWSIVEQDNDPISFITSNGSYYEEEEPSLASSSLSPWQMSNTHIPISTRRVPFKSDQTRKLLPSLTHRWWTAQLSPQDESTCFMLMRRGMDPVQIGADNTTTATARTPRKKGRRKTVHWNETAIVTDIRYRPVLELVDKHLFHYDASDYQRFKRDRNNEHFQAQHRSDIIVDTSCQSLSEETSTSLPIIPPSTTKSRSMKGLMDLFTKFVADE